MTSSEESDGGRRPTFMPSKQQSRLHHIKTHREGWEGGRGLNVTMTGSKENNSQIFTMNVFLQPTQWKGG